MSGIRFTAYFSPEEDKGLRELSDEEAASMNMIVRCGLRMVLGMRIPKSMQFIIREVNGDKTR